MVANRFVVQTCLRKEKIMNSKMQDVERRVRSYWYLDGIWEISIGGLFILLGSFLGLAGYFGEDTTAGLIVMVIMVPSMLAGIFGIQWIVNTLKTRLTYRRTGYVEYRSGAKGGINNRYFVISLVLIVTFSLIVFFTKFRELDSIVLATAAMFSVVFIFVRGKSSGVLRFYLLGVFSLLLGVGLSLDNLSRSYSLAIFFYLLGITVMVTGFIVLRRYISENPMPIDGEDDNE